MGSDTCRMCGAGTAFVFRKVLLGRHNVHYFHCETCGYFQTERPTWLDEAYASPIASIDTGVLQRNRAAVNLVGTFLRLTAQHTSICVDFAGGYGVFTRSMRDLGFDFYHTDPKALNLLARGFDDPDHLLHPEVCTAFEVLEHLADPIADLRELAQYQAKYLITSTEVTKGPPHEDWWYLAPESGQHVGFFETRTLRRLGQELGYPYAVIGSQYQVFSRSPIPAYRWWIARHVGQLALPLVGRTLNPKTDADSETIKARLRNELP